MSKKTLVIGASLKSIRYSNIAINMLLDYEHEVVAIGLRKGEIRGVNIITNITNFKETVIDTVTLYLNASRQVAYYDFIVELKPKRIIFNPGTENWEFMDLLEKNGIDYEVACNLVLLRTGQY